MVESTFSVVTKFVLGNDKKPMKVFIKDYTWRRKYRDFGESPRRLPNETLTHKGEVYGFVKFVGSRPLYVARSNNNNTYLGW